jgi:hypothetical protein
MPSNEGIPKAVPNSWKLLPKVEVFSLAVRPAGVVGSAQRKGRAASAAALRRGQAAAPPARLVSLSRHWAVPWSAPMWTPAWRGQKWTRISPRQKIACWGWGSKSAYLTACSAAREPSSSFCSPRAPSPFPPRLLALFPQHLRHPAKGCDPGKGCDPE